MPEPISPELHTLAANTIKMLAVDAVEKAQSGHPGLPMGAADYALVLWTRYLRHNPEDPAWPNRDRFVLSAGHGSMLLYALLHLSGYDLPMDELKRFRQWESKTPGHPEYGLTPGVETTTGPLGQGFGNGVGMAIAAKLAAARYNTSEQKIVDHYIYGIVSDGDLMEGVASEAASLAGHLGLGNIIYFYDDNRISIEGSTDLAFTEDRGKRFEAYNWQVLQIDGHDAEAAARAIEEAQADTEHPTLIVARTHIAQGSPNKVNTAGAHGEPLGAEEALATRKALGWPEETFMVPPEARALFTQHVARCKWDYDQWLVRLAAWSAIHPELAAEREAALNKALPDDLEQQLQAALPGKPNATRRLSGDVIQKIAQLVPGFVGGSADLAPSTSTLVKGAADVSRDAWGTQGAAMARNMHFGVREHGMGSILNGMALYGGFIPFGATFLIFSDYMRPSIRLANIMGAQVIYVFTHDSVFLGEDGPTHEPVEHLAALRCIPGMVEMRPADGPEVAASWAYALRRQDGPTALILTRQSVPDIKRDQPFAARSLYQGAYIVSETAGKAPDVVLIGTGSELQLAVAAKAALEQAGYATRVISMPSRSVFMRQDASFRANLIPTSARKVVVEAGAAFGWGDVVGPDALFITQDTYGHSAPYKAMAEKLGFTNDQVTAKILAWLKPAV